MKVTPCTNSIYSFGSAGNQAAPQNKDNNSKNPISKRGEKALLIKTTFFGGLAIGARLLFELIDGDFLVDNISNKAKKIVDKQHKNVSTGKRALLTTGAMVGIIGAFVSGFALLYTIFKAPKINYQGNINTFKKEKDMDVYIKGNNVEKELYTQMNEKAKTANNEEKARLKEQYMQMQMAKNKVPEFAKI